MILSDAIWQARFARDPRIVGRFIELDGVPREVVAVMPPAFRFPSARTKLWVPLGLDPRDTSHYWAGDYMPIVGRLRPGATVAQARGRSACSSRASARLPMADAGVVEPRCRGRSAGGVARRRRPVAPAHPDGRRRAGTRDRVANIANLSLSRAVTRERELGIRAAIGAGPRRIARQLLTESVLLSAIGAVAGLSWPCRRWRC